MKKNVTIFIAAGMLLSTAGCIYTEQKSTDIPPEPPVQRIVITHIHTFPQFDGYLKNDEKVLNSF